MGKVRQIFIKYGYCGVMVRRDSPRKPYGIVQYTVRPFPTHFHLASFADHVQNAQDAQDAYYAVHQMLADISTAHGNHELGGRELRASYVNGPRDVWVYQPNSRFEPEHRETLMTMAQYGEIEEFRRANWCDVHVMGLPKYGVYVKFEAYGAYRLAKRDLERTQGRVQYIFGIYRG